MFKHFGLYIALFLVPVAASAAGKTAGAFYVMPASGNVPQWRVLTTADLPTALAGSSISGNTTITGTLGVTGITTLSNLSTAGAVQNSSSGVLSSLAPSTSGNVMVSNGTAWTSGQVGTGGIASAAVTGSKIASATITGSNIASATVAGSNISSATITGSNIASQTITHGLLATRATGTSVAAGGIATSGVNITCTGTTASPADVGITATITTTGRPVYVMLRSTGSPSGVFMNQSGASNMSANMTFKRDGSIIHSDDMWVSGTSGLNLHFPTSSFADIDVTPSAGSHSYTISCGAVNGSFILENVYLTVFEI